MSARWLDRREFDRYKWETPRRGRFAFGYQRGQREIENAHIFDISASGVSFETTVPQTPLIGERVAVEFSLPGQPTQAWYATVMRVEMVELGPNIKVAARFLDMSQPQVDALSDAVTTLIGLKRAQTDISDENSAFIKLIRFHREKIHHKFKLFLIFIISVIAMSAFALYMLKIGSPSRRGDGPPIWEHKDRLPFQDSSP